MLETGSSLFVSFFLCSRRRRTTIFARVEYSVVIEHAFPWPSVTQSSKILALAEDLSVFLFLRLTMFISTSQIVNYSHLDHGKNALDLRKAGAMRIDHHYISGKGKYVIASRFA